MRLISTTSFRSSFSGTDTFVWYGTTRVQSNFTLVPNAYVLPKSPLEALTVQQLFLTRSLHRQVHKLYLTQAARNTPCCLNLLVDFTRQQVENHDKCLSISAATSWCNINDTVITGSRLRINNHYKCPVAFQSTDIQVHTTDNLPLPNWSLQGGCYNLLQGPPVALTNQHTRQKIRLAPSLVPHDHGTAVQDRWLAPFNHVGSS